MKILLTGANGQLGSCLQDRTKNFEVIATDFQELDISDLAAVQAFVDNIKPDCIINAAAYTAVDKAESDYDTAFKVNAEGPKNLAIVAKGAAIPLLHVSTDYVFNGEATSPYKPNDKVSPLGVYGSTKWDGEEFVRNNLDKHMIIRTAWVFSEYGNNFVKTMLRLAGERDTLGIVADQKGCPTYAGDLADLLVACVYKIKRNEVLPWGTHHFCGDPIATWHEFALGIFAEAKAQNKLAKMPTVNGIATSDYPTPAKRPAYSVMNCESLADFKVNASWKSALKRVISKL